MIQLGPYIKFTKKCQEKLGFFLFNPKKMPFRTFRGQTTENRKRNAPSALSKCLTEKHATGKLKAQIYWRKTYEHR